MDFRRLISRTRLLLLVYVFCALMQTSFGQVVGSDWAEQVGYSRFNMIFSRISTNTIAYYPSTGDISIVWTYARGINQFGRTVGYNHYDKRSNRWLWSAGIINPGSISDSCNYQVSPLMPACNSQQTGNGFYNGRVGWPNLIWDGQREAVVSFAAYPNDPNSLTRIHTLQPRTGAYFAQMAQSRVAVDTVRRDITKEAVFHVTAGADANNYLLTISEDTLNNPGLLDGGTLNNLILYHSTNLGTSWTPNFIPFVNIANCIGSVRSCVDMDAKDNMVAIVAECNNTKGDGRGLYLFKSNYKGLPGTWASRLISLRTKSDVANLGGKFVTPADDSQYSVLIDNSNKVHVTMHAGSANLDSFSIGIYGNGGLPSASFSKLYYWNEDMQGVNSYRTLTGILDLDHNGMLDIPDYGQSGAPGSYLHAGLSFSKLSVDQYNNLYITYSACVEGTAPNYNQNTTRDLYVMASYDGGTKWTNPINIAGRLSILNCRSDDDGSTGAGLYEEAFPSVVKRIGADDKLHMSFYSSDYAGFHPAANLSTRNMREYLVSYKAISTSDIEGSFLKANLPTQVCAGATIPITVSAPTNRVCIYGPLTATSVFRAELDTTGFGAFRNPILLGTFTGNAAGGTITARFPANMQVNGHIRVVVNNADSNANPMKYQSTTGEFPINVGMASPSGALTNLSLLVDSRVIPQNGQVCSGCNLRATNDGTPNNDNQTWTISPSTAGTIQPNGDPYFGPARTTIVLNPNYQGPMTISVAANNDCGTGPAASMVVNVVGGTAQYQSTGVMTTNLVGGQWLYASSIRSPFAPVSPPQLSNTFDLRASGQANGYYRYDDGTCQSNILYYSPTLGLSTREASTIAFQIYPNPATDAFRIEAALKDGPAEVVIYNGVGQVVHQSKLQGGERQPFSQEINTARLTRGVYLVRVGSGKAIGVQRLVLR
jgi:hypothetical protein